LVRIANQTRIIRIFCVVYVAIAFNTASVAIEKEDIRSPFIYLAVVKLRYADDYFIQGVSVNIPCSIHI